MLVSDNQAFGKNARVTATFGQGVIIRQHIEISVHAHVPKFGDGKSLIKQNICERSFLPSPSKQRIRHSLICTFTHGAARKTVRDGDG